MKNTPLIRFLRHLAGPFHKEEGQAMAEACVVIPVLLMLFLGLWQHSLLQLSQTRAHLAARHVAWARMSLNKSQADAKKYANLFFPSGTKLTVGLEEKTTYTDYSNNLIGLCASLTTPKGYSAGQAKASVEATVPALPVAPPKSPGKVRAGEQAWDFLSAVKTHKAQVVWSASEEQPQLYTFALLFFMIGRPDLIVQVLGDILLSELFAKAMSKISDLIGQSSWFGDIMEKLHLDFMGDLFGKIVESVLWLINDIYDLIINYTT